MRRGRISWLVFAALLLGATAATAQPLPCASVSPEAREYVRSRGACRDIKTAPRPRKATQSKPGASGTSTPAPPKLAQEPAAAAPVRKGSKVVLQVSDGSLAGAVSTTPVTAPGTAAAASPASAQAPSPGPASPPVSSPPQAPINPVTAPTTAFAPASATSLALARTPVASPPPEPIDAPAASGQFLAAFSAVPALIFVAGTTLGLLSGALLMRQWLLRGRVGVRDSAPLPTLDQRRQRVDQPPVEQQFVHQQPAGSDARDLSETCASTEIRFAAWLVPSATTIVLAPRRATDGIRTSIRATSTHQQARLLAPIEVGGDSIERALYEQGKDESADARVVERLCGDTAELAADELNRALDVDILDLLAQGWVQVPAVHGAVQLSAVTRGPPVRVTIDVPHSITSTSHVVLDTRMAGGLARLELALEIIADLQSATLAVREGRIDLVALGDATVLARLTYRDVLVKEHATEISGTPRNPSAPRPPATERPASVDFPI